MRHKLQRFRADKKSDPVSLFYFFKFIPWLMQKCKKYFKFPCNTNCHLMKPLRHFHQIGDFVRLNILDTGLKNQKLKDISICQGIRSARLGLVTWLFLPDWVRHPTSLDCLKKFGEPSQENYFFKFNGRINFKFLFQISCTMFRLQKINKEVALYDASPSQAFELDHLVKQVLRRISESYI